MGTSLASTGDIAQSRRDSLTTAGAKTLAAAEDAQAEAHTWVRQAGAHSTVAAGNLQSISGPTGLDAFQAGKRRRSMRARREAKR